MSLQCEYRTFYGADDDMDQLLRILRESFVTLDPDFILAGNGFDRQSWLAHVVDPDTEWIFCRTSEGTKVGLAGWRFLPGLTHLHALFVAMEHQHQGYARAMLHQHWESALERQPDTRVYTLHVRELATWARSLYESEGYHYYETGDETLCPELKVWIEACRQHSSWPLPLGKLLMYRRAG